MAPHSANMVQHVAQMPNCLYWKKFRENGRRLSETDYCSETVYSECVITVCEQTGDKSTVLLCCTRVDVDPLYQRVLLPFFVVVVRNS